MCFVQDSNSQGVRQTLCKIKAILFGYRLSEVDYLDKCKPLLRVATIVSCLEGHTLFFELAG